MKIKEIYERVLLRKPLEQRRFFDFYGDTADEIESLYGKFALIENESEATPAGDAEDAAKGLEAESVLRPLYLAAAADNIIYLAGGGDEYKSEFLRKANAAFLKYWNDGAKGARIKRTEW